MLIDLHCHTWPLSDDSMLSPDELIDEVKQKGLDGLCLTEHDFPWEKERMRELQRRHNFLLLPGIEVNTEEGHILAYGIHRYVYGMHRSTELARIVGSEGGALIAAHPYRRHLPWHLADESTCERALERALRTPGYQLCVGLEVINGRGTDKQNGFSQEVCRRLAMPGSAGTDSHARQDIGVCATEFAHPIADVDEFLRELKAGRFGAVSLKVEA